MNAYLEKLRSIAFGQQNIGTDKVTTDVHDNHKVHVTEHWDDRQSVHVDFYNGSIGKRKPR